MPEGVNEGRGKASYWGHLPFSTSEAEGTVAGGRTEERDACGGSGHVSHILPGESSLASHRWVDQPLTQVLTLCSYVLGDSVSLVEIVFPLHPFISYVGGVFSELCAPKLCEKTPEIISWAAQGIANISVYVATLVLLRRLCLYDFFFSSEAFSLPLFETGFSYLFYLISTQTVVFMLKICMEAIGQAYLKCFGYHTSFLSEQVNCRTPEIYQGDPLCQTKKIERECFGYLSHICEIVAIASITLLAYEEQEGQMISPAVSYQKRAMEELTNNAEAHIQHLMREVTECCHARRGIEAQKTSCLKRAMKKLTTNAKEYIQRLMRGVTECCHARRGIEAQKTSCLAKNLWRDGVKLDAWKNIFEEIIENLLSQCGGNHDQVVGAIENYLGRIEGDYRAQLTQLEAALECIDRDPRKTVIGLLFGLAGSCAQLYGTHAFMESYLTLTEQNIDILIRMLKKEIENAHQRVELSYSEEFDSDKQNEILNKWIKKFPQTQMEHRKLLKAWQDFFSFFLDQPFSRDPQILGVWNFTSFQAQRMTEEIGRRLKCLQYKMKKCIFKKFNGYVVLETIEE